MMTGHGLSAAEFNALAAHLCPDCGHRHFSIEGLVEADKAGGLAVNIACAQCGARFNVTVWDGALALAHRIDNAGEWPDRGFWRE